MIKLFLDDYRWPDHCAKYMHTRIGAENIIYTDPDWEIVRNYNQFVDWINRNGLPNIISFDHDLAGAHYTEEYQDSRVIMKYSESTSEKTGYHAAKWLIDYCIEKSKSLPKYFVHSMNPVGAENITKLLENFKKTYE